MSTDGLVRLERRDGVAVVTLDDPDRRNALSPELVDQLVTVLDHVEADPECAAVVVTGAPPAFCAGADLSHLGDAREAGLRHIYEGFVRFAACPLPTVAAVNGAAVGAGVNLALAADVRLAGASARFDTRFLGLGIHPGGGHTWWLQRLVGPQAAAAMVLLGEVIDGQRAAEIGLVWRACTDDTLIDEAVALAAGAGRAPRELVARTKQTLSVTATVPEHAAALEVELDAQLWSMDQPAFADRLASRRRQISPPTP